MRSTYLLKPKGVTLHTGGVTTDADAILLTHCVFGQLLIFCPTFFFLVHSVELQGYECNIGTSNSNMVSYGR